MTQTSRFCRGPSTAFQSAHSEFPSDVALEGDALLAAVGRYPQRESRCVIEPTQGNSFLHFWIAKKVRDRTACRANGVRCHRDEYSRDSRIKLCTYGGRGIPRGYGRRART